jgi:acyl-CoA reductase-like NAD-dependent aldehyde dehydrogenase
MPGAWSVLLLAMKARRGWRRIPPAQRRALLEAAQREARKRGPIVAKTVREQGPEVAKRVAGALRETRKRR